VDLGDGRLLLWVPVAENGHMPPNLRPTRDFFVLIGASGIDVPTNATWYNGDASGSSSLGSIASSSSSASSTSAPAASGAFGDALNQLILALNTDFSSIKGPVIPEDDSLSALSREYVSTVQLPGGQQTYLADTRDGTRLIVPFGSFPDEAAAKAKLNEVVAQIDASALPCCTLIKNENILPNLHTIYYLPFDLGGRMGPGLKNVILEVEMGKGVRIDTSGGSVKTYDQWTVNLRIYRMK